MKNLLALAMLVPSLALAQAPTAAQFQSYRQSMANALGGAYDAKAICETSAATVAQQNQQLQKQVADLKAQLSKAKTSSVPSAPKPEHNPPSP